MLEPRGTTGYSGTVRARLSLAIALLVFFPARAWGGGFDIPDQGTQALGRGAAFVAKADDATAIYYNPAGLARQRGTHLLVNGSLSLASFQFQRSGQFPDNPSNPATPWGGTPFPLVRNSGGPALTPFVAVTTDFGMYDRLTVAAGVYSAPMVGNRTFPYALGGSPAASRYDFVQSRATFLYPTASLGYRVTRWFDVGVSAHVVLGRYDQSWVSYIDTGQCPNVEYQPCDSRSTLNATAVTVAATVGAMLRPSKNFSIGMTFHTPTTIRATGTLTSSQPANFSGQVGSGAAIVSSTLPWTARFGIRYIEMDHTFEVYDIELDATYEAWGAAQGQGVRVRASSFGSLGDIDALMVHGYKNTYGVRAGGAYNFKALGGVLSLRAGGYFDSPATDYAYTRVDYDTLAKIAGTIGVGYKIGLFGIDFGYAAVASIPRLVGQGKGEVYPLNLGQGGRPVDGLGGLLDPINEGSYRGFTHILSLGIGIALDPLFGPKRPVHYGNSYESEYVSETTQAEKAEPVVTALPKEPKATPVVPAQDAKKAVPSHTEVGTPQPSPAAKTESNKPPKPKVTPKPKVAPKPKVTPKPKDVKND